MPPTPQLHLPENMDPVMLIFWAVASVIGMAHLVVMIWVGLKLSALGAIMIRVDAGLTQARLEMAAWGKAVKHG